MARRDFQPVLGLPPGEVCGFVGAVSRPTLLCVTLVSFRLSQGVLFSEPGTFVKRLGCAAQRRCQVFGGLLVATCDALNDALALGSLALVRGPPSVVLSILATLPLFEPTEPLAFRLLLVSGARTLISRALALVRDIFPVVGGSLALIRDPLALIRDPLALVRGVLALVRHPLALVGDPLGHRRLSLLTTAPTLTTQPVTIALEDHVIGRELRLPTSDLRAEALDLVPRRFIGSCS